MNTSNRRLPTASLGFALSFTVLATTAALASTLFATELAGKDTGSSATTSPNLSPTGLSLASAGVAAPAPAKPDTSRDTYYLSDYLSTTLGTVDAAGKIDQMETDAFGAPLAAGRPPARFTGKPYDEDMGAYIFPARNYRPDEARWMTPDPSGFPDGPNNVAYRCNPTFQIDPFGLNLTTATLADDELGGGSVSLNYNSSYSQDTWQPGVYNVAAGSISASETLAFSISSATAGAQGALIQSISMSDDQGFSTSYYEMWSTSTDAHGNTTITGGDPNDYWNTGTYSVTMTGPIHYEQHGYANYFESKVVNGAETNATYKFVTSDSSWAYGNVDEAFGLNSSYTMPTGWNSQNNHGIQHDWYVTFE